MPPASDQRTNEDWLSALQPPVDDDAAGELRHYLRGGLARAIGNNRDVDDADLDDFAQDAALRVLSKLESFRGDSRFTTWAMAIAIRVAYTAMRRRRWGNRSLEDLGLTADDAATSSTGQVDTTAQSDLLDTLRAAIDQALTPRQKTAILGELAGMPTAALADHLGTNANALYKLHHDARLRLRGALEERGFSERDVRTILEEASTT